MNKRNGFDVSDWLQAGSSGERRWAFAGVEVVEHLESEREGPVAASVAGSGANGKRANGRNTPRLNGGDLPEATDLTVSPECLRERASESREDGSRRERELKERIASLEEQLGRLEEAAARRSVGSSSASGGSAPGAAAGSHTDASASGMAVGCIDRHGVNVDVVASLKERLLERGRALSVAKHELEVVRRDRDRLAEALANRGAEVARLRGQIRHSRADRKSSSDVRLVFRRLFDRETGDDGSDDGFRTEANGEARPKAAAEVAEQLCGGSSPLESGSLVPHEPEGQSEGADPAAVAQQARGEPSRPGPCSARKLLRYLIPVNPGATVIELSGRRSYVGRGIEADVRINHPTVSRLHGVMYCIGGATIVEDARSTNGVFVNGRKVHQTVLKDRDLVAFGKVRYQFRVSVAESGL